MRYKYKHALVTEEEYLEENPIGSEKYNEHTRSAIQKTSSIKKINKKAKTKEEIKREEDFEEWKK